MCKIVSKNFLLSKLGYYVNVEACKLFCSVHISSRKLCLHSVGWLQWSPSKENNNKKTNSLHCRTAKLILSDLSIPTDDKLKALKLLPLTKQLKDNQAVMMFEVCNGETSEYIHSLFTRSTSRYGSNNFIPPTPHIDLSCILGLINLELPSTLTPKPVNQQMLLKTLTCTSYWAVLPVLTSQLCQLFIILLSWFHKKPLVLCVCVFKTVFASYQSNL